MENYKAKYDELELIGKGASGHAYLIQQKNTNQFFVSKIISLIDLNDKEIKQAKQELKMMEMLNHPNIVQHIENFTDNQNIIIIMEYCEERDLEYHINQQRESNVYFEEIVVINWFIQILMALHYLHDKNIIHRDLKTQNIFLTNKGNLKIGDFGISKKLDQTLQTSSFVGTPYYLSPEICEHQQYSFKTDIWALGCILYEICNLKRAFQADNLLKLIFKIVKEDVIGFPSFYSPEIKELNFRLLAKSNESRPSTLQILMDPYVINKMNDFIILQGKNLININRQIPIKMLNIHKQKQLQQNNLKKRNSSAKRTNSNYSLANARDNSQSKVQKPNQINNSLEKRSSRNGSVNSIRNQSSQKDKRINSTHSSSKQLPRKAISDSKKGFHMLNSNDKSTQSAKQNIINNKIVNSTQVQQNLLKKFRIHAQPSLQKANYNQNIQDQNLCTVKQTKYKDPLSTVKSKFQTSVPKQGIPDSERSQDIQEDIQIVPSTKNLLQSHNVKIPLGQNNNIQNIQIKSFEYQDDLENTSIIDETEFRLTFKDKESYEEIEQIVKCYKQQISQSPQIKNFMKQQLSEIYEQTIEISNSNDQKFLEKNGELLMDQIRLC